MSAASMHLPFLLAALAPALGCAAQEQGGAKPATDAPNHIVRRYPQDRDVPIAVVGSRTLTLGDLVDHIDRRHQPGFAKALEVAPEIQRYLRSDLIAPWVRHFADLEALRQSLGDQAIDAAKLEAAQSDVLKRTFRSWLETYVKDNEKHGRPADLPEKLVNKLLSDFQLRSGLAAELQGWLDVLEPDEYSRAQLHAFFTANARTFGGQVTVAHILVQHRDSGTGILLNDEGIGRAAARLADIKARLRPDGSNFEEVAARSDDTRTASKGGRLGGLHRYDDRMPATLCRAAWELKDGEVSDVVESQYGWHILKRIDFNQHVFLLFTDDAIPSIQTVMRRAMQEERLFTAREKAGVRLLL